MSIKSFLKRKNIEFSVRRYFIEALGAMALGLFASLIVGLILRTIGDELNIGFLSEFGGVAMSMMGPAIGVAVAHGLGAPPLVLFACAAAGAAGAAAGGGLGGPAGAFVGAVVGAEFGKAVSRETRLDIVVTPAVTILAGVGTGTVVGGFVGQFMVGLGQVIMTATNLQPVPMGFLVAVLMGLALTAPISSAALAIMLQLGGLAAGAATVGCAAQMVGFAVAGYRENGSSGLVSQGLGTSMLQIPNIVKNPWILLPPTLAGALLGPLATTVFRMENLPAGAGMGTSGLVGQIFTLTAMGRSPSVLLAILLLHFILPGLLAGIFARQLRRLGRIREGDYRLEL